MYISMGPTGIYVYLTKNDLNSLGKKIILRYNRKLNRYEYNDGIDDACMDILVCEENGKIIYEIVYLDNTVKEFSNEEEFKREVGDEIYSLVARLTKRWLMLRKLMMKKLSYWKITGGRERVSPI